MPPEKIKLYNRMHEIAKWTVRLMWFVLAVGLGVGFFFYAQEPMNEPACEASVLSGFYLAWGLFGLRSAVWGLGGILTKILQYQILEMALLGDHSEGSTEGWKAVAAGSLIFLISLLVFIIPGFVLGLSELAFFLR